MARERKIVEREVGTVEGRKSLAAKVVWMILALLLTLEPTVAPADLPNGQQMIASFVQSSRITQCHAEIVARVRVIRVDLKRAK